MDQHFYPQRPPESLFFPQSSRCSENMSISSHPPYPPLVEQPPTPTFPHFARLPPELRLKIWQELAAAAGARTVHLTRARLPRAAIPASSKRPPRWQWSCEATTPCPRDVLVLLHVCRDARREVLRRYPPLLAPKPNLQNTVPPIYFDNTKDAIFVDNIWPWLRVVERPAGLSEARHLNIHCNAWWGACTRACDRQALLGTQGLLGFRKLERLSIVFRVEPELAPYGVRRNIKRPFRPCDAGQPRERFHWPEMGINIRYMHVVRELELLKRQDPQWTMPEVKLVAWCKK